MLARLKLLRRTKQKIICFITGVPGSGKTLAGLNLAMARQRAHGDEHAVFLSGNGPLVEVLREALALDAVARAREAGRTAVKANEDRLAAVFIQDIHHFSDEGSSPNWNKTRPSHSQTPSESFLSQTHVPTFSLARGLLLT